MATELTFRAAGHLGLIPVDDAGADYCRKRQGELVQARVSQPRSLEQNALLWAVAERTFDTLPERWAGRWADKYAMVKGLQLALGIVDQIAKPTKDEPEIYLIPRSIAAMDREEANAAVDKLIAGMAHLLGVDVQTLLDEAAPWRAA